MSQRINYKFLKGDIMNSSNLVLQQVIMQLNKHNSESQKWEGRTAERIVAELNKSKENKYGKQY